MESLKSLQSFWDSSTVPKRLLKYVLYQIGIFDTATLDLDTLDFKLGLNSSMEFRDVGILSNKVAQLLNLPSTATTDVSKVSLVRVSIPVDIISGSVKVEIEGVQLSLSIPIKAWECATGGAQCQEGKCESGDDCSDYSKGHPISTVDLAQSFLAAQDPVVKQELQEVAAKDGTHLNDDHVRTASANERDTNSYFSATGLLAGFLQGIVSRLQVHVRSVTVQLEVSNRGSSAKNAIHFKAQVDSVDIGAIDGTMRVQTLAELDQDNTRLGKRQIKFNNIQLFLITDRHMFSTTPERPSEHTSNRTAIRTNDDVPLDRPCELYAAQPPWHDAQSTSTISASVNQPQTVNISPGYASESMSSDHEPYTEEEENYDHLAQSQIFSHEEAQNMCASAFSTIPLAPPEIARNARHETCSEEPLKSSTTITKQLLSLKYLTIYLPSGLKQVVVLVDPAKMNAPNDDSHRMPGAFSGDEFDPVSRICQVDEFIEIDAAPLSVNIDANTILLLHMLLRNVGAGRNSQMVTSPASEPSFVPSRLPSIRLWLQSLSLNLIEQHSDDLDSGMPDISQSHLGVITATMSQLNATAETTDKGSKAAVTIGSVTLGYRDKEILFFSDMMPTTTGRSCNQLTSISVIANITPRVTDLNIETLVLVTHIDLAKLKRLMDSAQVQTLLHILNDNAHLGELSDRAAPRGVKIKDNAGTIAPEEIRLKVNTKVKGLCIKLLGSDCSIVACAWDLKFVARNMNLRAAIPKIRIDGPCQQGQDSASSSLVVHGIKLEYFPTPTHEHLTTHIKLCALRSPDMKDQLDEMIKRHYKQPHDLLDNVIEGVMIGPLVRVRLQGSVLTVHLDDAQFQAADAATYACLPSLQADLTIFSSLAEFFRDDGRPGILTLMTIDKLATSALFGDRIGSIECQLNGVSASLVYKPMSLGLGIDAVSVKRNNTEKLISEPDGLARQAGSRMVMARFLGDETAKVRLRDVCLEYRVSTIMDMLGLSSDSTPQDFEAAMAQSVSDLSARSRTVLPVAVDVSFNDCVVGLNPYKLESKLFTFVAAARLSAKTNERGNIAVKVHVDLAALLLIDDISVLGHSKTTEVFVPKTPMANSPYFRLLCQQGYACVMETSSATANAELTETHDTGTSITATLCETFLVFDTCADSTQTLLAVVSSLAPLTPPSNQAMFRTHQPLVNEIMASMSTTAFENARGTFDVDDLTQSGDLTDESYAGSIPFGNMGDNGEGPYGREDSDDFEPHKQGAVVFDAEESLYEERAAVDAEFNDLVVVPSPNGSSQVSLSVDSSEAHSEPSADLCIDDDFFKVDDPGGQNVYHWSSKRNAFVKAKPSTPITHPFKLVVDNVHVLWNLHDGYDWLKTRTTVARTVQEVQRKAQEQRIRKRTSFSKRQHSQMDEDMRAEAGTEIVGDVVFNSIYVAVPSCRTLQDLASGTSNQHVDEYGDDGELVTGHDATGLHDRRTSSSQSHNNLLEGLVLTRSIRHMVAIDIEGVSANVVTFPPGPEETQVSADMSVQNFTIFDNLPTSTWRKFATYDIDEGERQFDSRMVRVQALVVKPIPELAATELVMKIQLLPLRLHVDQDTLEFLERFMGFKDESVTNSDVSSNAPFIQRMEIMPISVRLDFKPKRVNYMALRSGRTTELANFVTLEGSRFLLRRLIMYGTPGFARLGELAHSIWTADVTNTQIPTLIAGIGPAQSIVNLGKGFQELVQIPMQFYKRDGRVIRGLAAGARKFARIATMEVAKIGAKVALGTQGIVENVGDVFVNDNHQSRGVDGVRYSERNRFSEDVHRRQTSLYADQPANFTQGLKRAYSSLHRDLGTALDAIIAIPTDVAESQNAKQAAGAVLNKAPVLIFHSARGISSAVGQACLGTVSTLDKKQHQRVENKYKH